MCHKKGFPKYDDAKHIDSAAIVPENVKLYGSPRADPRSTEYTEEYCSPKDKERSLSKKTKQ